MGIAENSDDGTLFHETIERFWILRLVIEVRKSGIYVRLDPLQRSFRRVRPERIQEVSVTSYAATTYAGWHWGIRRTPSGNTVYRLRGGKGVEIVQESGERWFIGTQRPVEFKSAIEEIGNTTE